MPLYVSVLITIKPRLRVARWRDRCERYNAKGSALQERKGSGKCRHSGPRYPLQCPAARTSTHHGEEHSLSV